jgi:hypothetical protein
MRDPLGGRTDSVSRMTPHQLMPYVGQIVDMRFADGERARAHILSVDPDVADNHVFYDVIEVTEPGAATHDLSRRTGFACSATAIASVEPTDGAKYLQAPGSGLWKRPWWKFW